MTPTLEERVAQLEQEVRFLKERQIAPDTPAPWWKRIVGIYADDVEFDEAMRLGRAYRESLRPEENAEGDTA